MKRFYEASIVITAPKAAIWSLLTDASSYARWNTTIDRLEGTIALDADLKVWAKVAPGRAFPAHVTELSAPSRMVMPCCASAAATVAEASGTAMGSTRSARSMSDTREPRRRKAHAISRPIAPAPMIARC